MPYNVQLPNGTLIEGIPDDVSKEQARKMILEKFPELAPKTGVKDYLKDIPKALGRGAAGLLETSAIGASALLPEDYEKSVRTGIESLAKPTREYLAPSTPEVGESVSSKLLSGVGSTLPFFVAGPLGVAGRLGAGALGVAAGAGEARQEAERAGATAEERSKATLLGAPVGMLDILAPNIGPLKGLLTTALARGGMEGLTEAAQKVAQNYIAQGIYDPKRDVLEGSAEEGAYGAGVGALTSLLVDLALGRRAKGAPAPQPSPAPGVVAEAPPVAPPALPPEVAPPPSAGFTAQEAQGLRQEAEQLEQMRQQAIEQGKLDEAARIEAAMIARQERVAQMPGFGEPSGNVATMEAIDERRMAQAKMARDEAAAAEKARLAEIAKIEKTTYSPDPVQDQLIKRRLLSELIPQQVATLPLATPEAEPAGLFPKGEPLEKEPQAKPRGVQKFEFTPEEQVEIKSLKDSIAAINKDISATKAQKTSLFKTLEGALTLRPGSFGLADIDKDKASLRRLYNKEGKGALLEDLVEDGSLDNFLPAGNRKIVAGQENPRFDSQAAIEHIAGKLRSGDYASEIEAQNLEALEQQRDAAKAELEKLESMPAVNRELAARGAMRKAGAQPSLEDLIADAQNAGIDVEQIQEDVARRMPDATDAQYRGALHGALTAATSKGPSYEIGGIEYTQNEVEDLFAERFTSDEIDTLIEQTEAQSAATAQPAAVSRPATTTVPVARREAEAGAEPAVTEALGKPPVLVAPADFKLKKGRTEQVVLAARELAAGRITKQQYDQYVDYYMPIGLVSKPEAPLSQDGMKKVLKSNQVDKINATVADGTQVGLRMDINALTRGRSMGINGSVVAVHPENKPEKPLGYFGAAYVKNAKFATRNEQEALEVAKGIKDKSPQQTIEGLWVKRSSADIYKMVQEKLNDPEWVQVSLDPLRHSFFYDRANRQPVVSADEVLQVGRFVLAKNPVYADREQFKYALISANPTQTDNGNAHAKDFGGSVVYQNGDIGLVQAYSTITGDPVYIPFKGDYRVGKDVESIKTNPLNLTEEQKKELLDAKKQVVEEESKRKETVVKFDKDGLGFSKDIDPRMVAVLRGWKKMLNIPNNVYITTIEDARANSKNFTGPYRRIGSAALDSSALGSMRSLGNGEYYITFTKSTSTGKMLEVLAHELGHIHEVVVFNNASPEMKKAIIEDYNKWLASNKGATARQHIESMRARAMARSTANKSSAGLMSADLRAYWKQFDEWYADQVSRWATTQEKPLSVVEKFFAKLGAALKRFFNSLQGKKFLPTENFIDYMDRVTSSVKSESAPIASVGQMEMFAEEKPMLGFATKEAPPARTQLGSDALEMLSGIGRSVAEPEPGYVQKVRQSWDNARDNPKATREAAYGAFRRFADQVETWSFSSDAALNNQIRREVMSSMVGNEQKIGTLLNTSLSQTAHSDAIANLFLMEGNIRYNTEINKWEGVKDDNNIFNLSKQLDEIADKHGFDKKQIELIAHTAFEARRTQGLIDFNANIDARVEAMRAEAAATRAAGKPVAAHALSEKAQTLLTKKKGVGNMKPEQIQVGMEYFKMFPELNKVTNTWNGMRENALKVMVDTGLYTEEEADMLLSVADYVPFYREDQIEGGKGPKEFLRSLSVQADKALKGSAKPVNDIFDNMVRWTQYAINRGVRNRSAVALAETAEQVGLADRVEDAKAGDNVVSVWKDGQRTYYNMQDPLFMSAFRGLESVAIPTVKVFSKMADVLRQSVVLYPLFSVAQVPQDSFAAMFTSGLKPQHALTIPVRAVKEFIQTLRGKSKAHEELKNVGAVGVRDFTSAVIRADAEIFAGLKKDKSLWEGVKRKLGNLAMAADNAVRQATYEAALAQGLSKAEAIEKAFEIFNVRRRGNSQMLALAGQVIPFFNAYLAAQHVAYRTLTGVGTSPTERKAAFQTLAATTGSVMALSVLYAMMNGDDDDYLSKPTPTRDRLLMIPGTGGFSIPLRADIFALPKVLAEHTYMLMTDNGFHDGAKMRASMASLLANSIFSPTPVPQAIKPIVEAAINYDFFQQKPLVGVFQQKKELGRQFEDSTSEFSKLLGKTGFVSPIVADHLVRGMFGSFGGLFLYATNPILAEMSGTPRPSLSFQDALATIPNASGFVSKEYETALRKDFYALKEVTDRASATMSDLKTRSPQEIADYLSDEKNRARVALAPGVNQIATKLTNIRKAVTTISQATEDQMNEEEKQRQIKQLREAEEQTLKGVNLKRLRELAQL